MYITRIWNVDAKKKAGPFKKITLKTLLLWTLACWERNSFQPCGQRFTSRGNCLFSCKIRQRYIILYLWWTLWEVSFKIENLFPEMPISNGQQKAPASIHEIIPFDSFPKTEYSYNQNLRVFTGKKHLKISPTWWRWHRQQRDTGTALAGWETMLRMPFGSSIRPETIKDEFIYFILFLIWKALRTFVVQQFSFSALSVDFCTVFRVKIFLRWFFEFRRVFWKWLVFNGHYCLPNLMG